MWEGTEDKFSAVEVNVVRRDEGDVAITQPGRLASLTASTGEGQLQARMGIDDGAELAPRIAAGPEDPNRNLMHS